MNIFTVTNTTFTRRAMLTVLSSLCFNHFKFAISTFQWINFICFWTTLFFLAISSTLSDFLTVSSSFSSSKSSLFLKSIDFLLFLFESLSLSFILLVFCLSSSSLSLSLSVVSSLLFSLLSSSLLLLLLLSSSSSSLSE